MADKTRIKILLVDYEVNKMKLTEESLKSVGIDVFVAHDGAEALRRFKEILPDLVLLEAMLPKMHGFEVCKAIKRSAEGARIPVLITTAVYKSAKYKRQAINDYLANDYLIKPFEFDELLAKLREHLPPDKAKLLGGPGGGAEPAPAAQRKDRDAEFEKLLNETLADLLKSGERDKSREKAAARGPSTLDRLLEDTLSGVKGSEIKPVSAPRIPLEDDQDGLPTQQLPSAPKVAKPPSVPPPTPPAKETKPTPPPPPPADEEEEFEEASRTRIAPAETPPVPASLEGGGTAYGKYLLTERIALGGMAELFKAMQRGVSGFEKVVAIKRILPHLSQDREFVRMFVDEAKLAAQLTHQNIAQIYELGEIDGSYYIAMEFILGKNLRELLGRLQERRGKLPAGMAMLVASRVAGALHYAHRKKGHNNQPLQIVHRDISPQNVLISYEGEVKLVDFGIAKAAAKESVTKIGAIKGKILYMSPEQAWGRAIDHRSDIFSLGTLMYEMLTGERLFLADNEIAILEKVRNAEIPAPRQKCPDIPPELEAILLKALSKDPAQRFQTAAAMKKELDTLLNRPQLHTSHTDLAQFMRGQFAEEIAREAPELLDRGPDTGEEFSTLVMTADRAAAILTKPTAPDAEDEEDTGEEEASRTQMTPATAGRKDPVNQPPPTQQPAQEKPAKSATPSPSKPAKEQAPRPAKTEQMIAPTFGLPQQEKKTKAAKRKKKTDVSLFSKPGDADGGEAETLKFDKPPQITPTNAPVVAPALGQFAKSEPPIWQKFLKRPELVAGALAGIGILAVVVFLLAGRGGTGPSEPTPALAPTAAPAATRAPAVVPTDEATATYTPSSTPSPTDVPRPTATPSATATQRPTAEPAPAIPPPPTRPPAAPPEPPVAEPTAAPQRPTAPPAAAPEPPPPSPVPPTAVPPPQVPTEPQIKPGDFVAHPDKSPVVLTSGQPRYPIAARRAGLTGNVIVSVLVTHTGQVTDAKILSEPGGGRFGFGDEVLKVINTWTFEPATHQGVPVSTRFAFPIAFQP